MHRTIVIAILVSGALAWAQPAAPIAYRIETVAGANPTQEGIGARDEYISYPNALVADASGNIYYSDLSRAQIRKISAEGTITTVAGNGFSGFSGDGGTALEARINGDANLAVDSAGNLYIADTYNLRIRKVTPDGIIRTIAGNGLNGTTGDGGPALVASFALFGGITVDGAGNVYVATMDGRIRRITPGGTIDTVAGTGRPGYSGDGGPARQAQVNPSSVAADPDGTLYLADTLNYRIRKVSPDGIISTVAGTGQPGFLGEGDGGPAAAARVGFVQQLRSDGRGNLYFAEVSNRIRRIGADGVIQTIAGRGQAGYSGDGGPAQKAMIYGPADLALSADGAVYFSDAFNQVIRRIAPDGTISTYAGRVRHAGDGGAAVNAIVNDPVGVAHDSAGNVYFSESAGARIRKVSPEGLISNFAGTGNIGVPKAGPSALADFAAPGALTADGAGNVYVVDSNVVWRIGADGNIIRFAGSGQVGLTGDGGPADRAGLGSPGGLATDSLGNLYIADMNNHVIRKVTPDGMIQTIAGTGRAGFSGDGGPAIGAQFAAPRAIAVDASGNLYVADFGNRRVRKIDGNGVVATVAGNGTLSFLDNGWPEPQGDGGPAKDAQLFGPWSVAVDFAGDIFVAEHRYIPYSGNRIRRVTPDGIIDTIAGTGDYGFAGDGGLARNAQLHYVQNLATDESGRVYFADRANYRVRMLVPLYGALQP